MGDIDFEEQLELERLEREKKEKEEKGPPGVKVDEDGTKYEWDPEKKAWFPKIDTDFIAQYQMNYGVQSEEGEGDKQQQDYQNYYNYYQNYYQAAVQQEQVLAKKPKEKEEEESHEETVQKLANLENKMQSGEDLGPLESQGQNDSQEVMANYTEEQKKQYNDYWSYYYGTDYHDYYSDCMAQGSETGEEQGASEGGTEGEKEGDKKKAKKRKQQQKRDEGWFDVSEEHNTNVYVSGLPLDITPEEFKDMMTKYGLIMFDPRTKKPKLKLYMDENGQPKGDGRCCFIKKESVDLILNLLDGSEYRGHKVKVERAQFTMKGDFDPSKKKKKLSNREKKKLKERQAKLFDWRPEKPRGARQRHEKVAVMKNVFDPKDFEDDPMKINVLRDSIKTECAKYGDVKKVVVYDRHQDGVVMVTFAEAEECDMCIEYMNQRYWGTRRLLVATWDGKTKYDVEETEAEREERLKKWVEYLETGESAGEKSATSAGTKGTGQSSGNGVALEKGSGSVPGTGTSGATSSVTPKEGNESAPIEAVSGSSSSVPEGKSDTSSNISDNVKTDSAENPTESASKISKESENTIAEDVPKNNSESKMETSSDNT